MSYPRAGLPPAGTQDDVTRVPPSPPAPLPLQYSSDVYVGCFCIFERQERGGVCVLCVTRNKTNNKQNSSPLPFTNQDNNKKHT
jgi:hypothetical protein